ncbi:MAG: MBL fold metallo-hydrolase [Bacillota bacterium]|jgi:hydroxyacylglutathione hydrolase
MASFKIERTIVGPIGANCYFLMDINSKEMAIIDPGDEGALLASHLDKLDFKPIMIINTHGHWDHIGANKYLQDKYQLPIFIGEADADYLHDTGLNLALLTGGDGKGGRVERLLKDGDLLEVGNLQLQVIHTPGHSPGSICLYAAQEGILFSGDTLFEMSVGRSDLPGGDWQTLAASIEKKLYVLPEETQVYPGHGEITSIGAEKHHNPFLRA